MSNLNRADIIGHLGRDPEIRVAQNGTQIATMNVATSERWRDKSTGEKKEHTEWHRVVIFGGAAEIAEKYLKKGSKVRICGQLKTRKWTAQDGTDRYTTEIVVNPFRGEIELMDGASRNVPPPHPGPEDDGRQHYGPRDDGPVPGEGGKKKEQIDDNIPF